MADGFNRFNTGGQFYYSNQHSGHPRNLNHRNGSPIGNHRTLFQPNADTPSPNRSPGTNSPAHNPYSMYNHGNHRQNHGLLNGGAGHNNYQMNMHKGFQGQGHGHQQHHVNNQHHDHGGIGGQGGFGNHQHNMSASTLSNTTPHFTPAHLQNGTPDNTGGLGKPPNDQYAEHLREYGKLKLAGEKTSLLCAYYATCAEIARHDSFLCWYQSQRCGRAWHEKASPGGGARWRRYVGCNGSRRSWSKEYGRITLQTLSSSPEDIFQSQSTYYLGTAC